jgi:hypothetical protein
MNALRFALAGRYARRLTLVPRKCDTEVARRYLGSQ